MGPVGRNIHDVFTILEHVCHLLYGKVRAFRMQRHNLGKIRFAGLRTRLRPKLAGVVDENIQAPELLDAINHKTSDLGDLAHIGRNGHCLPTLSLNAYDDLLAFSSLRL